MLEEQSRKNRYNAFVHLVEMKRRNPETIEVDGDEYSYKTKRGLLKKYKVFKSFKAYTNSEYYDNKLERVNGFLFVLL